MRSLIVGLALMALSPAFAQSASGTGATPLRMPKAGIVVTNNGAQHATPAVAKVRPWRPVKPPVLVFFGLRAEWMD